MPLSREQVTLICAGAVHLQEGGKALQRDLRRLHRMRFSKAQCWLLHLGHSDSQPVELCYEIRGRGSRLTVGVSCFWQSFSCPLGHLQTCRTFGLVLL